MTEDDPGDGAAREIFDNRERPKAGLWWIVSGGVLGITILLFVSIYLPNLIERAKFFTTNALSLLVLGVIVVQAYIYRKQWEAMREGLIETRKMVAQNEETVVAAQRTVNLTESSLRISSRAYLFVYEATFESAINSGQYPLPTVVLKNSGKTPAFKHRIRLEQAFLGGDDLVKARKGIMPEMRPMSDKGTGIIGPDSYSSLRPERQTWKRPEDEDLAMKGEIEFYLWGLICYSDIFGEEHSSKFSLFAKNPRVTMLSYGLFGNDMEDEQK